MPLKRRLPRAILAAISTTILDAVVTLDAALPFGR